MQQRIHGFDDGADVRFRACTSDPSPASFLRQLFGEMNGDQQDRYLGKKPRDLPGNVEPVQIRHLKVQQNHIGRILLYRLQGLSSGSSFIADLPTTLLLEESAEIIPDRRVIVYYQNTNQAGRPSILSISMASKFARPGQGLAPGYLISLR